MEADVEAGFERTMKRLEGKWALVTGSTRGLGRTTAEWLAKEGANIVVSGRGDEPVAESVAAMQALGVNAIGIPADLSDYHEAHRLAAETFAAVPKLDILVNNAGITRDTLLLRMSEQQWDMVIQVNLKSAFNFIHALTPLMVKQKGGSIINMSSVVGLSGNTGQANYSASKAGLIALTKSVAKELGPRGIRANAIAPGFIISDMTDQLSEAVRKAWTDTIPLRRGGTPQEVANVCIFLASELSSFVSGQVIPVCGGMYT